jgi:hypothetical protein
MVPAASSFARWMRNGAEDARMHHLVHQPDLERLLGAHVLAGEDHVERGLETHALGQALRAARAGDESDLHLGEREDGLGRVGGDAIGAGQRELESAAQAGTVDGDDDRDAPLLDAVEHRVPEGARLRRVRRDLELEELVDVGAGDEVALLAGDEYRTDDAGVLLDPVDVRRELVDDGRRELVDRLAGQVEGEDGDAVDDLEGDGL